VKTLQCLDVVESTEIAFDCRHSHSAAPRRCIPSLKEELVVASPYDLLRESLRTANKKPLSILGERQKELVNGTRLSHRVGGDWSDRVISRDETAAARTQQRRFHPH
jgi:hypothetical protein